jgi:hypothetical protein
MFDKLLSDYFGNLGTDLPSVILILVFFANVIVFSLGIRIGLIFSLVSFSGVFVLLSSYGYNTNASLLLVLVTFGVLSLSLLFTKKRSESGEVV